MYAYIRGKLVAKTIDSLIIETQGIGYRLQAASSLLDRFGPVGEEITAYTHLYVREDIFALYGFPSQEDVGLFELLLTVSGVGPKVASNVVGSVTPSQFALAVITGDTKTLTQVKGIGKKGAERMILELKDKLKGSDWGGDTGSLTSAAASGVQLPQGVENEAISALLVLGYSGVEASRAVQAVQAPGLAVEELIRLALRQLVR
ncbi:MAG: Holliday junction branch migration protein RuvA [Clostridia bacterium]|nr:Holliday junction branch migration protein RuvA [Clostridia bacterium]